jgi:hypothetical protein
LRLAPLVLVEVVAFLLIIGETYLFFMVIVPIGQFPHSFAEFTGFALLKAGLTFGLGALWFLVMLGLTRLYVRSKLGRPTPTPSS